MYFLTHVFEEEIYRNNALVCLNRGCQTSLGQHRICVDDVESTLIQRCLIGGGIEGNSVYSGVSAG